MEHYARLAMREDEWYNNLFDESCAMPGSFAVFALGLEGEQWAPLVCDYLDRCDDEHSSLQGKFLVGNALFLLCVQMLTSLIVNLQRI